jgi:hypothetical protein|tara:strand:- start:1861 stop:2523 length:663 start_codon:yes stop_codon:yes gene_type:complete
MDIIQTRETFNNLVNDLLNDYTKMSSDLNDIKKNKNIDIEKNNLNITTLMKEIKEKDELLLEKDKEISNINKTKHEYEVMINSLNEKMELLVKEEDNKNKHDIIKVQAKELDVKDNVIEHLQNKIIKLQDQETEKKEVEKQIDTIVNETKQNDGEVKVNDSSEDEEDEEVWIKVKHKSIRYIIVKGEDPQYIYEITENDTKGDKVGVRTDTNGRKKYEFD